MFVKEKIEKEKLTKTYRRIDKEHPVDIYLGYSEDNYPSMSITLEGRVVKVNSSNAILVEMKKKNDTLVNLTFKLLDKDKISIFYKFCEDIIDATRDTKTDSYLVFIINRWNKWRSLFKRQNTSLLSENEVIGLIGELLFLKDYMIKTYGKKEALKSWGGPSKSHKDFEINDTWYEIKSVRQAANKVRISSIEQLDSDVIGNLVVNYLEPTNDNVEGYITLNKLVDEIYECFGSYELISIFREKLIEIGYSFEEEYDTYIFRFIKREEYSIEKDFPRIISNNLIEGVINTSYDIALGSIKKFLKVK